MNDADDFDAPGLEVDHEQDVVTDQANQGEDLDGEEVGSGDLTEVGLQEGLPGHALAALWCRLDAMFEEDPLDGVAADIDAEVVEGSADPRVSPAHVLKRHAHDKCSDLQLLARAAWTAPAVLAAVIFVGDELSVPAEDRVRCGDRCDLAEEFATEHPPLHCQSLAPVLAEPDGLVAELVAEGSVLLSQVGDDVCLLAVHPASEEEQQET